MRIFITGGTGLIGRRVASHALEEGHTPVVLTRDPDKARRALPEGADVVSGDPRTPGDWQGRIAECGAVVNLAGEAIFGGRWRAKKKARIRDSRVKTTENVARALAANAAASPALVSASGVGYYGAQGDEPLDESAAPGDDFLASVCADWEAATRPASEAGVRVVRLRIGIVLAKEGGALRELVRPFRLHVGGRIGSGKQWMSWIHADDLARAILFLIEAQGVEGAVNATAPAPVTNREFSERLAGALGRKSWLPAPRLALRLLFGEAADPMLNGQRVVPARLDGAGFSFRFPTLAEALGDLLR